MAPQTCLVVAGLASNDGKPTQINEHIRAQEAKANEREPHAMAGQCGASQERGRAQ